MFDAINDDKQLLLILGGARAGKSSYALRLASEHEQLSGSNVCFIATAQALDEDMSLRIARHRSERPSHWQTIEEAYRLDEALQQATGAGVVVVDCLTLFVSNWLLANENERVREEEEEMARVVENFLAIVLENKQTIICVSNEVGLGLVPETPLGRRFRDILGKVNQRFAQAATQVYLLVAGLPLQLKP
jgi:adenosylcobinamide kinase/adenosylcobinamide-phosphate guanylyltransferase